MAGGLEEFSQQMSLSFFCCQGSSTVNNGDALLQAVKDNDVEKVKFCLAEAANGETLTADNFHESFCQATKNDSLEIAKLLLEFGKFNVHFDNDKAIFDAGPECARWLLELGCSVDAINWESTWKFCSQGHLDLVQLVLPKFIASAPNKEAVLELMEMAGNIDRLDIIKLIVSQTKAKYEASGCSDTCVLGEMAENGYFGCLKYLNELGHSKYCASPDALQRALQNGQPECATYLIETCSYDLRFQDDWAFTMALENCYWDIIVLLVAKGIPANICDNMAVKLAASSGNLEMIKFLVKNGANIEVNEGAPLIRAAENGHLEVVKYLLSDLKAKMRAKALVKAKSAGRDEVADYLATIPIPAAK